MSARNLILVDLDRCISDPFHRDNVIGGDWDNYHGEFEHDIPCQDICQLINTLYFTKDVHVVCLATRPERWRSGTMQWLLKYGVYVDWLLMRPNENYDKVDALKINVMEKTFGAQWAQQVICLIDDNLEVCEAFNKAGVTTMQARVRK